jgi:hypothetical protein
VELPAEYAIVSEGYLNTNQTKPPTLAEFEVLRASSEALYRECLAHWRGQLPKGGEVTITVPVWKTTAGWRGLDLVDQVGDLGYTLKVLSHVNTRKLIYRRPDQIVGRQLLVMRTT